MSKDFFNFFRPLAPQEMVKMTTTMTAFPFDVGTMMETRRKNLQAASNMNQLFLEGLQVFAHRQGAMMADIAADQARMAQCWTQSDTPEDKIADQALIMKHLYERTITHMREISDMFRQSGHETGDILHRRIGASFSEVKDAVDKAKAKTKRAS